MLSVVSLFFIAVMAYAKRARNALRLERPHMYDLAFNLTSRAFSPAQIVSSLPSTYALTLPLR